MNFVTSLSLFAFLGSFVHVFVRAFLFRSACTVCAALMAAFMPPSAHAGDFLYLHDANKRSIDTGAFHTSTEESCPVKHDLLTLELSLWRDAESADKAREKTKEAVARLSALEGVNADAGDIHVFQKSNVWRAETVVTLKGAGQARIVKALETPLKIRDVSLGINQKDFAAARKCAMKIAAQQIATIIEDSHEAFVSLERNQIPPHVRYIDMKTRLVQTEKPKVRVSDDQFVIESFGEAHVFVSLEIDTSIR